MRRPRAARLISRASRLLGAQPEPDVRDHSEPLAANEFARPPAEAPPMIAETTDAVTVTDAPSAPVAAAQAAAPAAKTPMVPASSALGAIAFVHSEHDLGRRRSQLLRKARVAFVAGHGVDDDLREEAAGLAKTTRVGLSEKPTLIVAPAGWSPATRPDGVVVDAIEFVRIVDAYRQLHAAPSSSLWLRHAVDRARIAVRRERIKRAAPEPKNAPRQSARAACEPVVAELDVVANRLHHYLTLNREGR